MTVSSTRSATRGAIPSTMRAAVVRSDRYGAPSSAWRVEQVAVPALGPRDVLVQVMAAGVNHNGVWAALGQPLDVIAARREAGAVEDFHVGGSDAAGVIVAAGSDVRLVRVGDEVIVSGLRGEPADEESAAERPRVWGYETNWGAFAEYALADERQCHAKPASLSWSHAACFLVTAATAQRQLCGWTPHVLRPGMPVLVWGGAGGLGSMAIQLAKLAGARPVAVVSDPERAEHCRRLGAIGVIDRREFSHWGPPPGSSDASAAWREEMRRFVRRFAEELGAPAPPGIVLEHPGRATLATSIRVCAPGGMVVLCGATSGHLAELDLRYLWTAQKRLQGSMYGTRADRQTVIDLAASGRLDPCLSETFPLEGVGHAHQLLFENRHRSGQMAIRIGAQEEPR